MAKPIEVLSDDEIGQLLNAINNGEIEPETPGIRKIKIVDLKRPDRFSKYMKEISIIHNTLTRSWNELFKQYNLQDLQLQVASIDQLTYDEYVRSTPIPTNLIVAQGILDGVTIPFNFEIEVDPALSFLLDCSADMSKLLLDEYAKILNKRYSINLEVNLKTLEKDPHITNLDLPGEMGLLITYENNTKDKEGLMAIFLPYNFLRPILPYFSKNKHENIPKINNKKESAFMENRYMQKKETDLKNMKVQIVVELGRGTKTLKELLETGEGSIMEIDTKSDQVVSIYANNVLFGYGEICAVDDNIAVRFIELAGEKIILQEFAEYEVEKEV